MVGSVQAGASVQAVALVQRQHQQDSVEHLRAGSEQQHHQALVQAALEAHLVQRRQDSVEVLHQQHLQQHRAARKLSQTIQTPSLYNKRGVIE